MNSPLKNRHVLLTGASSGIGEAIARELAERGATLTLIARRRDRLEALEKDLGKKTKVQIRALDITAHDILEELDLSDVDVLINNAGLALGRDPIAEGNLDEWDEMWRVNVNALFKLTRGAVPHMLKRGQGDVVNLCSIAGHATYQGGGIYCATKHAVWAFTKVLREETAGKNLRVMQVSPGMVESEFSKVRFKGDDSKAAAVYHGMTPLTPADIARQVIFMLEQPRHVCIDEIISMPTDQGSVTTIHRNSK